MKARVRAALGRVRRRARRRADAVPALARRVGSLEVAVAENARLAALLERHVDELERDLAVVVDRRVSTIRARRAGAVGAPSSEGSEG